jgi:hypothetical protein
MLRVERDRKECGMFNEYGQHNWIGGLFGLIFGIVVGVLSAHGCH